MAFLASIRKADRKTSPGKMVWNTILILLLGIVLGIFSKYLDHAQGTLPYFLALLDAALDFHNFLGRFPFWILLAVAISVYSRSPGRAAINVFVFFAGMVSSYYWYSKAIAGFFPRSYAMIWAGFTMISPLLAAVCWYAKGRGPVAFLLSAMISAVFFNMTFAYGWLYFDLYSVLEGVVFLCSLAVLKRSTIKETMGMVILGAVLAPVLKEVLPYALRLW